MVVETERLILRQLSDEDVPAMAAINADPEVMRFIGDGRVHTEEQCRVWIQKATAEWAMRGFGRWAAVLRDSGDMIGWIGLSEPTWLPEVMPVMEVGWRIGRHYWGKGLATEGAAAALEFAFREQGADQVMSIHHEGNVASVRVMEKIGMTHVRDIVQPGLGIPLRIWSISRKRWSRLQGASDLEVSPDAEVV